MSCLHFDCISSASWNPGVHFSFPFKLHVFCMCFAKKINSCFPETGPTSTTQLYIVRPMLRFLAAWPRSWKHMWVSGLWQEISMSLRMTWQAPAWWMSSVARLSVPANPRPMGDRNWTSWSRVRPSPASHRSGWTGVHLTGPMPACASRW